MGTGVGATLGGAAAGAAAGAFGGPVGAVVGGVAGAVAGGLAGKAAAEAVNPPKKTLTGVTTTPASLTTCQVAPMSNTVRPTRLGWSAVGRYEGDFDAVEPRLADDWRARHATGGLAWSDVRPATRAAWDRASTRAHTRLGSAGPGRCECRGSHGYV